MQWSAVLYQMHLYFKIWILLPGHLIIDKLVLFFPFTFLEKGNKQSQRVVHCRSNLSQLHEPNYISSIVTNIALSNIIQTFQIVLVVAAAGSSPKASFKFQKKNFFYETTIDTNAAERFPDYIDTLLKPL